MPEHPASASLSAVTSEIEARHIRHLELQFTDVMGAVKTVSIPADQLEEALSRGVWFDGSSVESLARTAESDMYLSPDLATFAVLPWAEPTTGRLICEALTPDGNPYPGDPRGALRRQLSRAAALGLEYRVGPEIEFFLLQRRAGETLDPLDGDHAGYFDFASDLGVAVRQEIVDALGGLGVAVNSAHHEIAEGQHELDLAATPALQAADSVVTLRYAARAVARRHGVVASFMPKPFFGASGSGMHVHQSLNSGHGSDFADPDDAYGLSAVAKHFMAGQLHHAAAMCAVLSPLVNSYKRLVRGYEAPVFVSWARTNRAALMRVPHVRRLEATRVELRSPDPSCNPYLAFTVMLAAGLDGVEHRRPLPDPVEEALYGFDDGELQRRNVHLLPENLKDALAALEADEVVREALGEPLVERFVEAKHLEWDDYRVRVTPWEIARYLERG